MAPKHDLFFNSTLGIDLSPEATLQMVKMVLREIVNLERTVVPRTTLIALLANIEAREIAAKEMSRG